MSPRKEEKGNPQPASTFGCSFRLTGSHGSCVRRQAHVDPTIVPGAEKPLKAHQSSAGTLLPVKGAIFFTQVPDIDR